MSGIIFNLAAALAGSLLIIYRSRLSGLGLGKYQRGLYRLQDNSTVHIFAETDNPKFLNVKFHHGNDIYLNYEANDLIQQQLVKTKN